LSSKTLTLMSSGDVSVPRRFTTEAVIRLSWPVITWFDGTAIRASMTLLFSVVMVAPVIDDTVMSSPEVEFRNP
jgi:hypothetical protein